MTERVIIGFDYRRKIRFGYQGLDRSEWLPSETIPDDSLETNGLNLFDSYTRDFLRDDIVLAAFDAPKHTVKHMASTFGLSHLIDRDTKAESFKSVFKHVGFDVVDLYVQETFLTHIELPKESLNRYGLIGEQSVAISLSEEINDEHNYDVVGVWISRDFKSEEQF